MKKWIAIILTMCCIQACDVLQNLEIPVSGTPLTTSEIVSGLKEALSVGTNHAIDYLGQENGFYGNALLRIPFPEEAKVVEEKLRDIGMDKLVDDFILTMNRGAEKAVKKAGPIFLAAIREMTFEDARQILNGADDAATNYFRNKTTASLIAVFKPDVSTTLDQVEVTRYWTDITTAYNKIPFTRKVETDLSQYVTEKTVQALFIKLAEEEKKIRTDPQARVTELLRRVFGSNAT
ncbi:MAG: DUF4197 domain-containing protein [Bacteroidales bacterium]